LFIVKGMDEQGICRHTWRGSRQIKKAALLMAECQGRFNHRLFDAIAPPRPFKLAGLGNWWGDQHDLV
jgi:hypothetical protein